MQEWLHCTVSFYRNISHTISTHNIFRVPEIGEDLPDKNPLLRSDGLPEFNNITIEKCIAAIGKQTVQFESGIKSIEASIKSADKPKNVFNNVLNSLEQLAAPLDTTWGLSKALYLGNKSLMPTKCYMTIHERAKRARAAKFNSLDIYNLFKEENGLKNKHMDEEKRILKKYLVEGKLNGLELSAEERVQLNDIINRLGTECSKFKSKADTATKQFSHVIIDPTIVGDFPEHCKVLMAGESNALRGPWKVTLQPQISTPFLEYCPDSNLRWNVWQAQVQRASGYTDKALENSTHLEEIRFLRREQAKLLGYKNFAEMSMETKMAGTVSFYFIVLFTEMVTLFYIYIYVCQVSTACVFRSCDVSSWKYSKVTKRTPLGRTVLLFGI